MSFFPYIVETAGKKKKTAKHDEMRWTNQNSKNNNFRDSFLNNEKEFHHTVKDFFA